MKEKAYEVEHEVLKYDLRLAEWKPVMMAQHHIEFGDICQRELKLVERAVEHYKKALSLRMD
jgi:hypothetical protein